MNQFRVRYLTASLLSLLLIGCEGWNRGFRFYGTYAAPQSGYRLHLISQGYVRSGADLSSDAFAWVKVCPLPGTVARPFKLSLTSTSSSETVIESADQGLAPIELKSNSDHLLHNLLAQAGYQNPIPSETAGSLRVMTSALTGSKGVILKGQIDTVQVVETRIDYGYSFDQSQPPVTWIKPNELVSCH